MAILRKYDGKSGQEPVSDYHGQTDTKKDCSTFFAGSCSNGHSQKNNYEIHKWKCNFKFKFSLVLFYLFTSFFCIFHEFSQLPVTHLSLIFYPGYHLCRCCGEHRIS